jgi:hypothetical protein
MVSVSSLCFWVAVSLVLLTMNEGASSRSPSPMSNIAFASATTSKNDNGDMFVDPSDTTTISTSDIPLLPAADPDSTIPRLRFGESLRFEQMGPVILNTDGTTRRIANWDEITKHEQDVTWRRIKKRNEERRKVLLEKLEQQSTTDEPNNRNEASEL